MTESIVVINPNSTAACTEAIDTAMQPLRLEGGPTIECVTMNEGPPGIESQHDSDSIILPLCDYINARDNDAGAFVIACFSDPGLHAARERTEHPVMGIAESAYLTAMTQGERFGVISILEPSVKTAATCGKWGLRPAVRATVQSVWALSNWRRRKSCSIV